MVVFAIFLLLRNTKFSYGSEAGIVNATTLLLTWMELQSAALCVYFMQHVVTSRWSEDLKPWDILMLNCKK